MSQSVIGRPSVNPDTSSPDNPAPTDQRPHGLVWMLGRWFLDGLPTIIVMSVLVAIGYYGHTHHWKIPTFAEFTGQAKPVVKDWCEEHGVPESECVICNPDLMPASPDYGWCTEHGVNNCPLHHPDVAELKKTPVITAATMQQADRALALRERPDNNAACKVYQKRIQFTSNEAVQQAGVEVELVDLEPLTEWVSGTGEIRYDPTRLANLSSRVPGTAWRVLKNIGDRVRVGEILAVVDAAEVGRLKSNLVKAIVAENLARKNFERLNGLRGSVPGKDILEAEAILAKEEAEVLSVEQSLANLGFSVDTASIAKLSKSAMIDRLRFLGFPSELAEQFRSQTASANLIPVRSSMNGAIMERTVVSGEVVSPGRTLFKVADSSLMWLILNVPLEKASLVKLGQQVQFQPNGSRQEVTGKLSWISTAADKQTRMVKVRAEIDNTDGRLRDETFGAGRIILRQEKQAVVIPRKAMHWEGCCQIVFVRNKHYFDSPESPKVFQPRTVRTGFVNGDRVEIIAGLLPGEIVVTEGSDVLRAQLLKNSLGAGCSCSE